MSMFHYKLSRIKRRWHKVTQPNATFHFLYKGTVYMLHWYEPYYTGGWIWKEGNYSCDCNRAIFLRQVFDDFPELDCGEEIELIKIDEINVTSI